MIRVFVCGAALAAAALVSGCAGGSISEAEQQSLAAAATASPKLQAGDKIKITDTGKTSSAATTRSIRVVKSHCLSPERLRQ